MSSAIEDSLSNYSLLDVSGRSYRIYSDVKGGQSQNRREKDGDWEEEEEFATVLDEAALEEARKRREEAIMRCIISKSPLFGF